MFDNVGNYLKYYGIDEVDTDTGDKSDHVKTDCNDIYRQTAKSLNEIYNKYPYMPNSGIAGFMHPFIGYPYAQMSVQMMDITNKKAFIVLGIFEYDSVPHDMKLLIFAESEEKVRELIDETYSTDTSFFMIKNIKEV